MGKTVDFISFISLQLGHYTKIFNTDTLDFGDQLIDTMTEVIQGPCRENQKALIAAKTIDFSRDFINSFNAVENRHDLQKRQFDPESADDMHEVNELKKKLVTLLLSLLEGTPDPEIISRMSQSLDFELMKARMRLVY